MSIALKNMEGITISGFSVDDNIVGKDLSRPIAYEFSFSNCLADGQYFFDGNLYIFANEEKSLVKIYPNFFDISDNPNLAARELYSQMRSSAESNPNADCLVLQYDFTNKKNDPWEPITDRLKRAASFVL